MSHKLGLQTAPNTQFQAGYFLVMALYNVNKFGCPGHMNNTALAVNTEASPIHRPNHLLVRGYQSAES